MYLTARQPTDLSHWNPNRPAEPSYGGRAPRCNDKEGSVLRIETTINKTEEFEVYRAKQGDPGGEKTWRTLQRSVGELWRRGEVSAAANGRYLQGLTSVTEGGRKIIPAMLAARNADVEQLTVIAA